MNIIANRVRLDLYKYTDPYAGFDTDKWAIDLQSWNQEDSIFYNLIEKIRPNLILEVGSWKGASAIQMGRIARSHELPCEIVCIDTFLAWVGAPCEQKNGFPILYEQFLANIIKCNLHSMITPFPQTSDLASVWLKTRDYKADLIYIDGAHGFGEVYSDLVRFWPLLRVGGFLFGDDYSRVDVRRAVTLFSTLSRVDAIVTGVKWSFEKTRESTPIDATEYLWNVSKKSVITAANETSL